MGSEWNPQCAVRSAFNCKIIINLLFIHEQIHKNSAMEDQRDGQTHNRFMRVPPQPASN